MDRRNGRFTHADTLLAGRLNDGDLDPQVRKASPQQRSGHPSRRSPADNRNSLRKILFEFYGRHGKELSGKRIYMLAKRLAKGCQYEREIGGQVSALLVENANPKPKV